MSWLSADERRVAVIAALLAAALALAVALTIQAVGAMNEHRAASQRMLRDFAAIAADELIRRTAADVESYGFAPLRQAVVAHLTRGQAMPDVAELRADRDVRLEYGLPLIREIFMVDVNAGSVTPPVSPEADRWMLTRLLPAVRQRRNSGEPQSIRVPDGNRSYLIAYGLYQLESGRVFGMLIDESALASFLRRGFARRSIFPPSAGGGHLGNDAAFVDVALSGRELFHSPGAFDPDLGVTRTLGSEYGEIFRGAVVRSSIQRPAAPLLVAGGVPPSRLPMLTAILGATALLILTAAYLLRRERQLMRLRSDFVSGVSHELRTPLTQIRMFAETLLFERVRDENERRRSLEIIDQEARRLTHLVENVLTYSRGERGALELFVRDTDAAELIRNTIEQFKPLAASRHAQLVADLDSPLRARIDAEAWKQVLINLLDNAVAYGPAGQTVHVAASTPDGLLRMSVTDHGPGIPASQRDAVWRKFVRLPRDRGTHRAGTGIGLSVVKEIVTLHRGRCWIEDSPEGGARFIVEVPR